MDAWIDVMENIKQPNKLTLERGFLAAVLFLFSVAEPLVPAQAAPSGGQISAGAGAINQAGVNTTITQNTQNLAIDWLSFSIGSNEAVRFNQPNQASIALNRITGQNPSQILGGLSANGQVFVLNPNGVLFGPTAQVNVGGLVASTLGLSNNDFMAGRYSFSNAGKAASVVNQGSLNAANGGYIAMLAPEVRNEGVVAATLGTALLAAGDKITLNLNNGSLLSYSADQGSLKALAENKQLIQADGGQVFMSAKAANLLSTAVVNNTGIVEARTLQNRNGTIVLLGDMQAGQVNVGGTLDASAPSGGNGGFIETSAAHVKVAPDVKITTQAAQGKSGNWLIDPADYTIAATGGDITGAALATNLATTNVTILSTQGTVVPTLGNGDIFVNDIVSWNSVNSLTLSAIRNINVNSAITNAGTGAINLTAAAAVAVNANLSTAGAAAITAPTGLTQAAAATITTGTGLTANVSAASTSSGVIAGAGGLTKTGTGTLTLAGLNTYTGATTINAGTLSVGTIGLGGAAGNLGAATNVATNLVLGGGTLQYTGATASTDRAYTLTAGTTSSIDVSVAANTLTMSGAGAATTGALTKVGAGTLALTGANAYTGGTTINAGTLAAGATNALAATGAVTVNGGTFSLGAFSDTVGAVTLTSGSITGTTSVLTGTGYTVSSGLISAILAGAVPLTKTTTGAVTLSGANTYSGATTISAGTLTLGGTSALGATSGASVTTGGTLDLNGFTLLTAIPLTLNGTGVGGTAGALTNGSATAATYSGLITLGSASSIVANSGNLVLSNTGTISGATFGLTLDGTNTASSLASIIGTTTGALTKNGTGTWTLGGANTYTGGTTINAGTLAAGATNALAATGAVTVNGGTFSLGAFSDTVGAMTLTSGSITGTTGVLTGTGYTVSSGTISAILAGAVPLTKTTTGTVTLSGVNTYSGVTTINAGTLSVGTIGNGLVAGNLGAASNIATNLVLGGGTLQYTGATASTDRAYTLTAGTTSSIDVSVAANTLTMSGAGALTTGALTKVGAGTLALTGANAYTGGTTINAGTLAAGATNALAATGAVTVNGGTFDIGAFSNTVGAVTLTSGSITGTTGVLTGTGYTVSSGTISAILAGAVPLTKTTTGTVTLSGVNTYSGVTTINAGILSVGTIGLGGATGNLGAATNVATNLVLGGGTLQYTGATASTDRAYTLTAGTTSSIDVSVGANTLTMSGAGAATTGALTKVGAGTLALTGANAYTGATTINGGILSVGTIGLGGVAGNLGAATNVATNLVLGGGTLQYTGVTATTDRAYTLTAGTTSSIDVSVAANTLTMSGAAAATTGALTKVGAGTLVLAGTNAYSGATTISAGTLKLGGTSALGATSGASVTAGGTLDLNGFTLLTAIPLTLNGTGVGGTAGALTNSALTAATYSGAVTLGSASSIVAGAGAALSATGTINGAAALNVLGGGTVTLGGSIGNVTPLASLTGAAGTTLNINGGAASTSGAQTYGGTTTFGAATTLTGVGISATGAVTSIVGTLTLAGGAGNVSLTSTANNIGTVSATSGANISIVNSVALAVAGINSTGLVDIRTQTGDLSLTGAITTTNATATAVTLMADTTSALSATGSGGNFKNTGNVAISMGTGGAWRIYTGNPTGTVRGGLVEAAKSYNVGVATDPLLTGKRLYFRIQPTLTITTNNVSKVYNGTGVDPTLGYTPSGMIDGDTASIVSTAPTFSRVAGTNVGTYAISATGAATNVGYTISYANTGLLTITPVLLTAAIIGAPTRVYNGGTVATLAAANYSLTGFVGTEGATVNQTVGAYNSKDVATATTVSATLAAANFAANVGTTLTNYTLPATASGAGSITALPLTAAIIGTPTRVYDGTTTATLAAANYSLTGFLTGEGATVNQTVGTYNFKDVTTATTVTATLAAANYTVNVGTTLTNYTLPATASGAGKINPYVIASLTGTRAYDGTTSIAPVAAAPTTPTATTFTFSPLVGTETLTLTGTGSVLSANASATAQTLTLGTLALANGTGLASNYTLTGGAVPTMTITPKALTAAIIGAPTRAYNGTTAATLAAANYSLTGFATGEGATVNQTVGAYNSKDVATATTVSATLAAANFAANVGTTLTNYTLPATASGAGSITAAVLTAAIIGAPTRAYNGTTAATLAAANYSLTGFITGEGATVNQTVGAYNSKDVATATTVSATLAAANFAANVGTTLTNYTLPATASGAGSITAAVLTAAIIGAPTRAYNGTTAATLAAANYSLTGFATGEGATVNQTVGAYNSKDVATATTVSATLAAANFAANVGTTLTNYTLPATASGAGSITALPLTAAIIGTPTRVYDGTTTATLAAANYSLTGFLTGEGATVNQTVGTYNFKDVTTATTVTATLAAANYTVNVGTTLTNYTLPATASGAGKINPRPVSMTGTRAYDGTMNVAAGIFTLGPLVSTETLTLTGTGTVASANASATPYLVTLGTLALGNGLNGGLAANYTFAGGTQTATITAANIAIVTASNASKTYGSTYTLGSTAFTATGLVGTDTIGSVTLTSTGAINTANAGAYPIVPSNAVFTSGVAGNYTINYSPLGTLTVNPAVINLSGSRVYDTTTVMNASVFGAIAGVNSETLTLTGSGSVVSKVVGAGKVVTLGTLALGNGTGLASNYTLTGGTYTATITAANLLVNGMTAANKVYDTTTAATLSGIASITPLGTDAVTLAGIGTGTFNNKNVGTAKPVTVTGYSISGVDASNYTLVQPAPTANITAANLAITGVAAASKVYNATTAATLSGGTITPLTGDVVTLVAGTGAFADANVGTAKVVTASGYTLTGTDAGNYALAQPTGLTANITAAQLTAAIIGTPTKAYDGGTAATLAAANYSLTGFVGTEGATVNQTIGTYNFKDVTTATTVSATLAAANYTATGTTLLSNYTLPTTASGAGKINPRPVSMTGTRPYDGTMNVAAGIFTLGPLVGTETLTLTGTGTVASANASATPYPVTLGTLALGNGLNGGVASNYTFIGGSQVATITAAAVAVVTANNASKIYGSTYTLGSTAFKATGLIGTDTIGSVTLNSTGAINTANAGTYPIVPSNAVFTSGVAGNYTLSYVNGTLTVNPYAVSLTGTRAYDGTTNVAAGIFTFGPLVGTETLTLTGSGTVLSKDVGVGKVVTLGTLTLGNGPAGPNAGLASNYTLTGGSQTATINPAVLTAAITGVPTKVYNGTTAATLAATNYTLTGFIGTEGATVNQTVGTYNFKDVTTATTVSTTLAAANYTATGTTLLSNYVLPTAASGAGTITAAPLTATITGIPTKVYNGTTAATLASANYAFAGFATGEGATVNQTVGAYNSKDVATATTVNASLAAANYTANTGTLLSNYILATTASGAGKINPYVIASLTGTRQYDGTTSIAPVAAPPAIPSATSFVFSPLVGAETVTVAAGAGSVASANVGTYPLAVGTLALGNGLNGGLASNYTLAGSTLTGVITQAIISLNAVRTYDTTTVLAASAFHGFGKDPGILATGNGETLILTGSGSVTSKNVVAGGYSVAAGTMSLGTLALSSGGTGAVTNYTLVGGTHTANILAAPLKISGMTAANKVYDGTTAATLVGTAVLSNPFAGDVVSLGGVGVGTFNNKNAASNVLVNVTGYSISGADAGNYNLIQPQGITANIAQRPLTWTGTPSAVNRIYDGTQFTAISGITFDAPTAVSGMVAGDAAFVTGIMTTTAVGIGNNVSVALTGKDASNYNFTPPTGFLTVNISPANLTLSAVVNSTSKIYGTTVNLGNTTSFTATGLAGTDKIIGVSLNSTGAVGSANVGSYAILATDPVFFGGAAVANNYVITSASTTGTLTVNPYTINSMTANRAYDATTAMNGSAFGAVAGATIAGVTETLSLTGSGSVLSKNVGAGKVVTLGTLALANGSGLASNYLLSTAGTYTANITPANLSVTGVTAANKVYDATTAVTLGGIASITPLATDIVALGGTGSGAFADKNAGTGKAVIVTGYTISGADAANYTLVQPLVAANITQKAIAWSGTPVAATREYDATRATTVSGAALSGVIAGDVAGLGGLFADPNVGLAKPVSLVLTGTDGGNYSITQPVPGMTANITPRNLAVTADNKFMMFGGTMPPLTYRVGGSGLVGADTLASIFTGSLYVNVTGILSGNTTPITQGSLVLTTGPGGNYVIGSFVNGVMTVQ